MSQRNFKDNQGYITFALGEPYLKLAYAQALSIKATQQIKNYAVVIDNTVENDIDKYKHVFDEVIKIDYTASNWDMSKHWKVFQLTPWRETVMLDADILFVKPIDHWWDVMRLRDVCLTNEVKDFKEDTVVSRRYRKLFDENVLPNIYAGFTYFRYSQISLEFFTLIKTISDNWEWVAKEHLIKNQDLRIRLDELFALATRIFGIQHVTLPYAIPTFTHGKGGLWGLSEQQPWYEQMFVELSENNLLVEHYPQRIPFHYHHKEWITDDILGQLERNYEKSINCTGKI